MLSAWSRVVHRHRGRVLVLAAVVLGLLAWSASASAGGLFGKAVDGGFDDPRSEASVALDVSDEEFGRTAWDVVGHVLQPRVDRRGRRLPRRGQRHPRRGRGERPGPRRRGRRPAGRPDPRATGLRLGRRRDRRRPWCAWRARTTPHARPPTPTASPTASSHRNRVVTLRGRPAAVNADVGSQVAADLYLAEGVMVPIVLVLLVVFLERARRRLPATGDRCVSPIVGAFRGGVARR